uniref:Uncharacterized protein n=1 Tax=viral metagenome TaxID=1070528 RepID=A0A6H1ZN55_9ZZZZ
MKQLADIPKTTKLFWYVLGETLCNMIRNRVQKEHKNFRDETFVPYNKAYAKKKAAGDAVYKGGSQASTSTKPDMTLTGKTMANLHVTDTTDKHVIFGWMGLHGGIVDDLYGRKKNYQIVGLERDDPFAPKEMDFINKHIEKDIDKKIKAYCKTPIKIKVGV